MDAQLGRSKRGGGSAPAHCKTSLRSCMLTRTTSGGLRKAAKECMSAFNSCRSGKKAKKRTTKKRRTAKRKRR